MPVVTTIKDHELISPSSFTEVRLCHGRLILHREDTTERNEPAIWGSRCHALSELWLKKGILDYHGVMQQYALDYPEQYDYDPEAPVDEEMIKTANIYVKFCKALGPGDSTVEEKVMLCEDCGGTADYTHKTMTIFTVVDLKGGSGIEVDAEGNEQELIYAAASIGDEAFLYDYIDLIIVQPRILPGTPKIWRITPDVLDAWLIDVFYPTVSSIKKMLEVYPVDSEITPVLMRDLDNAGYLNASAKACRWCSAKSTCPAALDQADRAAVDDFAEFLEEKAGALPVLNQEGLYLLENIANIRKTLIAIEETALKALKNSIKVPGFKLVAGRKSKAWKDEAKAEAWLKARRFKQNEMYKQSILSPAAAITLVKGRKFAKDLDELYIQSDGKPTLALASDKRPDLANSAEDDFAEFKKETV